MTRKRSRPVIGPGGHTVVDDATRMLWAERLRATREARGVSQALLADYLGCAQQTVSAWERGTRTPNLEARKALANALKLSVTRLFPEPVAA